VREKLGLTTSTTEVYCLAGSDDLKFHGIEQFDKTLQGWAIGANESRSST